jgi:hypothetical protein
MGGRGSSSGGTGVGTPTASAAIAKAAAPSGKPTASVAIAKAAAPSGKLPAVTKVQQGELRRINDAGRSLRTFEYTKTHESLVGKGLIDVDMSEYHKATGMNWNKFFLTDKGRAVLGKI